MPDAIAFKTRLPLSCVISHSLPLCPWKSKEAVRCRLGLNVYSIHQIITHTLLIKENFKIQQSLVLIKLNGLCNYNKQIKQHFIFI